MWCGMRMGVLAAPYWAVASWRRVWGLSPKGLPGCMHAIRGSCGMSMHASHDCLMRGLGWAASTGLEHLAPKLERGA